MSQVRTIARSTPRRRRNTSAPLPATRGAYPRIYETVLRIPRGRVATYGQVAAVAGIPHAPRVAGYALHALPWHRVVATGGRLSLGKLDPSGALTQRLRLEHEGVRFDGRGCVDMERHTWRPRSSVASTAPRAKATRRKV